MTASVPLIKSFNCFSSWSSMEAGPACFFRVLTMPSVEGATEMRRRSGVISSFHKTHPPAQVNHTCGPGTVVAARLLTIPEQLQRGISRHSVLTAGLTVGCAVDLAVRAKLVGRWSQSLTYGEHTQRHVKLADVIPWPVVHVPSIPWQPSRTQVPVVYSGHTYKTHTHTHSHESLTVRQ